MNESNTDLQFYRHERIPPDLQRSMWIRGEWPASGNEFATAPMLRGSLRALHDGVRDAFLAAATRHLSPDEDAFIDVHVDPLPRNHHGSGTISYFPSFPRTVTVDGRWTRTTRIRHTVFIDLDTLQQWGRDGSPVALEPDEVRRVSRVREENLPVSEASCAPDFRVVVRVHPPATAHQAARALTRAA